MPSNLSPKKVVGRPRKYSAAAAIEAKKQSDRRRYLRSLQARGPADFIAYEPPRFDVPADTPPTGLRTSADIRVPLGDATQPENDAGNTRVDLTALSPRASDEEVQVAAQLRQIQIDEQELNRERDEHEAEVSRELDAIEAAGGILMEMRSANISGRVEEAGASETPVVLIDKLATARFQAIRDPDIIIEGGWTHDKEPLLSCFSAASIDEPIMMFGNDSIASSTPSNRSASIHKSREELVPLGPLR